MSWTDRMLDGDEGSLKSQREGASIVLWVFLVFGALCVIAVTWSLVGEALTDNRFDVPPSMLATVAFLWVLALFTQERYRRRKLEARVLALEAQAK
jgi:hypothetical protein